MPTLLTITCTVPTELEEELQTFLTARLPQGWRETQHDGRTTFQMHLDDHGLGRSLLHDLTQRWPLAELDTGEQETEDWALAWKDFFVPLACGDRFEVLPPWHADQATPGREPIVIEPKMAFGTGHHATTALCLEAIGQLFASGAIEPGNEFLDLGTGSGILGIGLCRLGLTGMGLDIDPQAVTCAAENLAANKVEQAMSLAVGSVDALQEGHTFRIIVANILSGPLIEMARPIVHHLAEGGSLILSGILAEQGQAVAQAYTPLLHAEPETRAQGEWVALVWERTGRP